MTVNDVYWLVMIIIAFANYFIMTARLSGRFVNDFADCFMAVFFSVGIVLSITAFLWVTKVAEKIGIKIPF